jgi:hypothetical protein
MNIDEFIRHYNIKPAEAIMMKKKSFGMLDHYVLYLGVRNNHHEFVANYDKGVAVIPDNEIVSLVQKLQFAAIECFPGDEYQRQFALERAFSRIGQQAYGLITNNCEHYKNYVHYGEDISKQVETFGGTIVVTGITAAVAGIAQDDPLLTGVGILAALFGGMIYQNEKNNNQSGNQTSYQV